MYAGFGLASHLGVLSGIPTVGVAKKLCHVDGLESSRELKAALRLHVRRKGDHLALRGQSGRVWGEVRPETTSLAPVCGGSVNGPLKCSGTSTAGHFRGRVLNFRGTQVS